MTAKSLGILTYIDAGETMLEDFSWLYKSWIFSGAWKTSDLIVCCHPEVFDQIPAEPGIVRLAVEPIAKPGSRWENYPYINSIGCLRGPHIEALAPRYSHFLRSDADVFLTAGLVNFRPDVPVMGRGHYMEDAGARAKIVDFGARHGIRHMGYFNCGSSLMHRSDWVCFFIAEQCKVAAWLLEEFKDDPGEWPGWCRNVLTMYAAELVANHHWETFLRKAFLNVLDYETCLESRISQSPIVHIHALHIEDAYWSKANYRRGLYKGMDLSALDLDRTDHYCHWIATRTVDEIKGLAGYPA